VRRPPARRATPLGEYLAFTLKLTASVLAGAAVTTLAMLVWQGERGATGFDPAGAETTVYRAAAGQSDRQLRPLASWDAESNLADQRVPKTFAREVKTVKFIAPQGVVTASLSPVTLGNRSPVAVPMDKAPDVKSWRYQLQGVNPYVVANSSADLMVIDAFSDDGAFTKAQVEQMRRKPDGSRRIVLSYMSIGEAESYRWYWPNRSSVWLGPENPK
jgi:hypothetical protein